MTRASLGVQDFNPEVQAAIGRIQPETKVEAAVAALRPAARGISFSKDDLLRAEVIEEILCHFTADLEAIAARHGYEAGLFADDLAKLAPLIRKGWVEILPGQIRIKRHETELARLVASAFDRYLASGSGQHSVAV